MGVASAGNKILFAGGITSSGGYSSRVDIFDITTGLWTTAELSQPGARVATAVLHNKIFFCGGITPGGTSSKVDIFDVTTNSWTTAELDNVQYRLVGAAAGDKVVFAGGVTAHIYNLSTNSWSAAGLSARPGDIPQSVGGIAATVIDNTIYFAGGEGTFEVHKAIDIYNTSTNEWITSLLSESKGFAAGIAVGHTNYWAGGNTHYVTSAAPSCQVEIRDANTGISTYANLFQPNAAFSAVQKNDTIVFFTGRGGSINKFDIYDTKSRKWSIGVLPENVEDASIISVNNTIYVAGGKVNGVLSNQLRKLEF
jgi:hypothetical protein